MKEVEERTMESIINEAKSGKVKDARALELVQGMLGWPGFRFKILYNKLNNLPF